MNHPIDLSKYSKNNQRPGDYMKDGLLYCRVCNEAKQMRLGGSVVYKNCRCIERGQEQQRLEEKRKETEERRSRCLPRENQRKSRFATAEKSKALEMAKRYADKWDEMKRENIGLLFWGNTGSGKTYNACCIANELIDRGIPVRFEKSCDLVNELASKGTDRKAFLKGIGDAPLLIIDDIGAERDTSYTRELLCSVIDARAESGKPLIVTTNYTLDEIKTGSVSGMERIFDRLNGMCVPVQVSGTSRRQSLARDKMERARELLT